MYQCIYVYTEFEFERAQVVEHELIGRHKEALVDKEGSGLCRLLDDTKARPPRARDLALHLAHRSVAFSRVLPPSARR